jgi:mRNA-degrading endonuclease RelE of RelBE toxin-antitoxin system
LYHGSEKSFRKSINSLSKTDQRRVKPWLRKLLSHIKQFNNITDLTNIPLSNYILHKECGPAVKAKIGNDVMYRISFDDFNLYVSVTGQNPKICELLFIKIGKWS